MSRTPATNIHLGKRTLLFMGLVFALVIGAFVLSVTGKAPDDILDLVFKSPEDGSWVAVSIDGQEIGTRRHSIDVRRGKIVAGYDGCNEWPYQDEARERNGERMIVTNLQECPDNILGHRYWAVLANSKLTLVDPGAMLVSGSKARGYFRRCRLTANRTSCISD